LRENKKNKKKHSHILSSYPYNTKKTLDLISTLGATNTKKQKKTSTTYPHCFPSLSITISHQPPFLGQKENPCTEVSLSSSLPATLSLYRPPIFYHQLTNKPFFFIEPPSYHHPPFPNPQKKSKLCFLLPVTASLLSPYHYQ